MSNISLVIPAYNAEQYIEGCVRSALNQSSSYSEIVIVDDGSTDNTLSICKRLEKENPSVVKVFSISNSGAAEARRFGADKCTGDYLMFLDSDDELTPDYLEKFLQSKPADDILVVVGDNDRVQTSDDYIDSFLRLPKYWGMPRKLYPRKMLGENCSNLSVAREIRIGEDFLANLKILCYCREVRTLIDDGYVNGISDETLSRKRSWSVVYERKLIQLAREILKSRKYNFYDAFWHRELDAFKSVCLQGTGEDTLLKEWKRELIKSKPADTKLSKMEFAVLNINNRNMLKTVYRLAKKFLQ